METTEDRNNNNRNLQIQNYKEKSICDRGDPLLPHGQNNEDSISGQENKYSKINNGLRHPPSNSKSEENCKDGKSHYALYSNKSCDPLKPVDLTFPCSSTIKFENYQTEQCEGSSSIKVPPCPKMSPMVQPNLYSNKYFILNNRKRHANVDVNLKTIQSLPQMSSSFFEHMSSSDYLRVMGNKQLEIWKAAKSLFSKRTRTLFHWMYPNAPKHQLKTAIAASWDTLGQQEKEFYVSQVLGRFGFPQSNLMVNPQLDGIKDLNLLTAHSVSCNGQNGEESSKAVSHLLMSEGQSSEQQWLETSNRRPLYTQRINRKTRRIGRPPGSKNRKQCKEESTGSSGHTEVGEDEFEDDPELSRELQQFRWSLNFTGVQ